MKNIKILPAIVFLALTSCGNSSHPLVGNKFNFLDKDPIASYAEGYDATSYFALIGSVNSAYNSLAKLNAAFHNSIPSGTLEISETAYEGGYFAYADASQVVIYATMYPSDGNGINTSKVMVGDTSKNLHILASGESTYGSVTKSFVIYFSTFEKIDDATYHGILDATYASNTESSIKATFTYDFTLVK